ncbi:MAG TPA: peptidoglycan DD-metalloendopeptidase family protein [bacterium]|nr:peptidoglycan DD-metalloendopeptidase family protein [bacterium]
MRERTGLFGATVCGVIAILATTLPAASSAQQTPPAPPQVGGSKPAVSGAASAASMLTRIQQQLSWRRRRLAQVARQERTALAQLSGAQERLERALVHLNQTAVALSSTQRAVQTATRSLSALTTRLAMHERLMGTRVRAFYERGPVGYLDLLLGSADVRDFITRSYLVSRVVEQDLALYHEVAAERHQREDVQASLVAHQEQLSSEQEQWVARREETSRFADERRRLLEQVRTERRAQEAAIRELEVESARITEIIRQSARGGRRGPILTLRNGELLWPVPGRVSSGYGWRIHPIFGTREFHTGIDIAAPYGTAIQAAQDGIVIYNGWMRGYGMLVILDHGGGLTTTYSHLSAGLVRVGDHVARGATIARIGSTGWSTGPHLFFEVREDGRPVNPLGG